MDVFDVIKNRRSIRQYLEKDVEKEKSQKIVEAGTYAPTGKGKQSPIILAITNKELIHQLSKINAEIMGTNIDPFYHAPCVLIVLADKSVATHVYDGSIVMQNMMLEAYNLGLGSCWIHRAKQMFETEFCQTLLKELGIENEYEGIGNLIVGYPKNEHVPMKKRKDNYVYYID